MNYFDIVLITLIIIVTIRGIFRGLISELVTLVALILGFVITIQFLSLGVKVIINLFPDLPDFIARTLVFLTIFIAVNLIVRFIGLLLNKFAKVTFLQPINKAAGGLFAFAKITILLSIVFILVDFIPYSRLLLKSLGRDNSFLYDWIKNFAPNIYQILTSLLPGSEQLKDRLIQGLSVADSTAKEWIKPQ